MTRLSTAPLLLCAVIGSLSVTAWGADAKKPNIVWIFADDCGIDCFSCYGSHRFAGMTPNIDALAKSGTKFERCYSTPLCGPSRALLMTGRYGFRTGGMTNQSASQASFKTEPALASILNNAGYATGMAGKWRQVGDSPGDWGFSEFITDPTAGGWFWKTSYTKNGQEVTTDKEVYYPDVASDFAVDFIRRHKEQPFFFYLSEHLIHGPILRTPDSKPDASPAQWYDDNLKYLDKTVGKVVAALDEMGLRENTVIIFTTDNGTAPPGYLPIHDPDKTTGRIGDRYMNGRKGTLLEGGSRVPLIASWKGTLPEGKVRNDLIDFSDFLPTFAELAGAKLPADVKFDGTSFAPQLRGEEGQPRDWIFVQLGRGWYVRDDGWKLNEKGELFSMKNAPFEETLVNPETADRTAQAAHKKLQAILAELNPAGGKVEPNRPANNAARRARRQQRMQQQQQQKPQPTQPKAVP